MARLNFQNGEAQQQVLELRTGTNRFGRAAENDVRLEHHTVSGIHCEIVVGCGQVSVRDCGSTNGTFLDGRPISEAVLVPGQILRLGELELLVTDTEIPINIPKFDLPTLTVPSILPEGPATCRRHRDIPFTYRCEHCHELLCNQCIHRIRRRGGKLLRLCPLCSYPVEALGQERKKRSFVSRLKETTKLLFARALRRDYQPHPD